MARHKIRAGASIKNVKPKAMMFRLSDGDGLYLLIKPNSAKRRRLDYSIGGKRKTLTLGVYPDTMLSATRKNANDAHDLVAAGTDPGYIRKAAKQEQVKLLEAELRIDKGLPAAGSFEQIARDGRPSR